MKGKLFTKKAKAKSVEKRETGQAQLVGIVEMVNPEQKYVLIRCEFALEAATGRELVALDASGAQAKLALSAERKGKYLTADIKSGNPQVSNLVLMYPIGAATTPSATAATTPAAPTMPVTPGSTPVTTAPGASPPTFGPAPVPKYNVDAEPPPPPVRRPPSREADLPLSEATPSSAPPRNDVPDLEPVVK